MTGIRKLIDYLGSHGGAVLIGLLIVVAGVWGFVELADDVREGDTQSFDQRAIDWAVAHEGPHWVQIVGRDVTALGGVAVLFLLTGVVAGFLLIRRQYHALVWVLIAVVGGAALNTGLKGLIGRDRPPEESRKVAEMTKSFPSGHAMLSATVYLTLGTLLARLVSERSLKVYLLAVAVGLTLLVGVSRVYLRVHWPTDVLAGWTAGLVWAVFLWVVTTVLQRRGVVERDDEHG